MSNLEDPKRLHINERLTCRLEIAGGVFTFEEKIMDLDPGGILIGEPDLAGQDLKIGQSLLVRYYRRDSAYQFMTKITGLEEKATKILLRLAFPAQITRYQRRMSARVETEGTVVVGQIGSHAVPLRGFLLNFSTGGLFCSLPQVGFLKSTGSPVGVKLRLDVTLDDGTTLKKIQAQICRVVFDQALKTHVGVHISFNRITEKQGNTLMKILRKHQ